MIDDWITIKCKWCGITFLDKQLGYKPKSYCSKTCIEDAKYSRRKLRKAELLKKYGY